MPSLGADMEHGKVLEWLVKPGDTVHRGDVVAVVDTDKAAIEVECFVDGTVTDLVAEPGAVVPVGGVLAHIGAEAPAAAAVPPAPHVPPPAPVQEPPVPAEAAQVRAASAPPAPPLVTSPLVRRLAAARGVNLRQVADGEAGHVIHRADVDRAAAVTRVRASPLARRLAAEAGVDLASVTGTGRGGAVRAADVVPVSARAPAPPRGAVAAAGIEEDRAESMRHAIAALMDRSNREIPHYYLTATVDMAAAAEWLRERNRELPVEQRLVPAALLLKASALAAREVGQLNGFWVDGAFRAASSVDLGLIVSLRRGGILVPVIPDAPSRSVGELMAAMRDLVQRARTGRLRGSDLAPPSVSVTNLGDQGVDSVLGVIYPPQVALVGFGTVTDRPCAVDGMLAVRPVVTASLAADHRASDGAIGARFLNHIARLLQRPEEL